MELLWGEGNVLKPDCGEDYTTLDLLKVIESNT